MENPEGIYHEVKKSVGGSVIDGLWGLFVRIGFGVGLLTYSSEPCGSIKGGWGWVGTLCLN